MAALKSNSPLQHCNAAANYIQCNSPDTLTHRLRHKQSYHRPHCLLTLFPISASFSPQKCARQCVCFRPQVVAQPWLLIDIENAVMGRLSFQLSSVDWWSTSSSSAHNHSPGKSTDEDTERERKRTSPFIEALMVKWSHTHTRVKTLINSNIHLFLAQHRNRPALNWSAEFIRDER